MTSLLLAALVAAAPEGVLLLPVRSPELSPARRTELTAAGRVALGARSVPSTARTAPAGRAARPLVHPSDADLRREAEACRYDVLCLVELGAAVGAGRVVVARVRPRSGVRTVVELVALDVGSARIVATERLLATPDAVAPAVGAGLARLLGPPDVELAVRVDPPSATVELFGAPLDRRRGARLLWWSGTWEARVTAPGFEPRTELWSLRAGRARRTVRLRPDPLAPSRERR